MTTTIQVQEDTIAILKQMREQFHLDTYDALLKKLIVKAGKPKKSLWGAGGRASMKEIVKELRDKHDCS